MNKPLYLLPFIFVYKVVLFIVKFVFFIPKYAAIGFFFINITALTLFINGIYKFTSLFLNGFIFLSFLVFKILTFPFSLLTRKKTINDKIVISSNKEPVSIQPELPKFNSTISAKNDDYLVASETPLNNQQLINEQTSNPKTLLKKELQEKKEFEKQQEMAAREAKRIEKLKQLEESNSLKEKIRAEKLKRKQEIKAARVIKNRQFFQKILSFFRYYYYGFMLINFVVYKTIKYIVFGALFPFVILFNVLICSLAAVHKKMQRKADREANKRKLKERITREEMRNKAMIEKRRKAAEKLAAIDKKREDAVRKKEEEIARKKAEKDKNTYINDKVTIEKKTIGDQINSLLENFIKFPKFIKASIVKKYNSLSFIKNKINQQDISREALLINFDGDDAVKSTVKILYEYLGKSPEGKVTKGYFEAFSKVEVHSFLLSEGFEVYSIRTNKWIKLLYGRASTNNTKIKSKDLIFFLTQLSTYIKAGIPLVEALKILSRQFRQKSYQRIFKTMIYDLTMGENFSTALEKQGVAFPRLLVNMVKASEMTGELPEVLDNMSEYFTATEKTRKQMITAMIYPSIVFVMSMAVVTFIIMFVVPKFVDIYASMDAAQIPGFTIFVINMSAFIEKNIIWLLLGFAASILTLHYLYKNVKVIRTLMQWMFMKTPVLGNIIIFNEVTIFTKTFSSLLSHNVFITDSMEVLNRITNNEIYKMIIVETITNLARGEKISKSFQNHWAFPIPAYEMLVTGERTGQLPEMMGKVSDYYQDLHQNSVTRLKSLIEPILLVFLTFVVGGIILAVIVPMFSMFTMIK